MVAGGNRVERVASFAEQSNEDVQPTGAALGIAAPPDVFGELDDLLELREVHATAMQHDRVIAIEAMRSGGQLAEPALNPGLSRKETALELPEIRAEPKIQARRLDLVVAHRNQCLDGPLGDQVAKGLTDENAVGHPQRLTRPPGVVAIQK